MPKPIINALAEIFSEVGDELDIPEDTHERELFLNLVKAATPKLVEYYKEVLNGES